MNFGLSSQDRLAPKGRPYRSWSARAAVIVAVVLAHLAVGGLLYYAYNLKAHHASPEVAAKRLLAERTALLHKIDSWNARARSSAAALGLPAIMVNQPGSGGSGIAGSATAAVAASSSGSSQEGGVCDPPDPEPKFRPRPRSVVEAENPELVSLLRKHAKNNEIMLTLANGIMICKNSTICWWNGGNILESFITILKHNNITNYLIGVMDDETEKYLTGRDINFFRVKIEIPKSQEGRWGCGLSGQVVAGISSRPSCVYIVIMQEQALVIRPNERLKTAATGA